MDEVVKLIVDRTGISEDLARMAAQTVIGFLKDKLPAPIAGQIDGLLGNSGPGSKAGNLLSGLGGILGKK